MNQPLNKRRILQWAAAFVLAAPVLLFCASLLGFFPWSPINCTHRDVDICTGRVRFTRYMFWLRVHESVEDSALTRALRPEDLAAATPDWYHAVTLSPGLGHSPHYRYHSAIVQIMQLEFIWGLAEFTPDARRASAMRVLQSWQETRGDDGVRPYLWSLEQLALSDNAGQSTIDEKDLPTE